MIDKSSLKKLALGNYVYNNKANAIATIISVDESGVKTRWDSGEDKKYHLDIDLIPITIEYLYNILGLNLELREDDISNQHNNYKEYYDYFNLIRFNDFNIKVGDTTLWYVHVDNFDYDTKGAAEVQFINEFQNFINSIDFDLNWVIEEAKIQQAEEVIDDNTGNNN